MVWSWIGHGVVVAWSWSGRGVGCAVLLRMKRAMYKTFLHYFFFHPKNRRTAEEREKNVFKKRVSNVAERSGPLGSRLLRLYHVLVRNRKQRYI